MNSLTKTESIPGTILQCDKMNGATGGEFLKKVFFITDGIMLAQIREITGIDGTTLQNWIKRGWVKNPSKKVYNIEQLARILLINMMRDTMQLSKIIGLLVYINGNENEDELICESVLYDYVCRVLKVVSDPSSAGINALDDAIDEVLTDYEEKIPGAPRRIRNGIKIIVMTYYATVIKAKVGEMASAIGISDAR